MSYATFKEKVNQIMQKADSGVKVVFSHRDGRHYATFSNGVVITGNQFSCSVSVNWGNSSNGGFNHRAFAAI